MNWNKLGQQVRESAMDAHDGELPELYIAYSFFLDNPHIFVGQAELDEINGIIHCGGELTLQDVEIGNVAWPMEDDGGLVPEQPNDEFIRGYYTAKDADEQYMEDYIDPGFNEALRAAIIAAGLREFFHTSDADRKAA